MLEKIQTIILHDIKHTLIKLLRFESFFVSSVFLDKPGDLIHEADID